MISVKKVIAERGRDQEIPNAGIFRKFLIVEGRRARSENQSGIWFHVKSYNEVQGGLELIMEPRFL